MSLALPDSNTTRFFASPVIARQYAVWERECGCTRALHKAYRRRHDRLDKLIVLDGTTFRWEGLGNSGTRWMGLLRWGYATGRATFLQISRDDPPRLDPGEYFEGWGGVDWHWASQRARVRQTLAAQGVKPVVLEYSCARRRPPGCSVARLRFARNGSVLAELPEPLGLLQWMRSRDSPRWIRLVLAQQDSLEHSYSRPEALRTVTPLTTCPLVGAPPFRVREACLKCETFGFMQPRPKLMRALLPLLPRLDPFDVLVGVHLRTGYADWAFRNDDTYFPNRPGAGGRRRAAMASAPPPPPSASPGDGGGGGGGSGSVVAVPTPTDEKARRDAHWKMLDAYFSDCQRGQDGPCFNWVAPHKGSPPRTSDALRCGSNFLPAAGGRGGSSPAAGALWTKLEGAPEGFLSTMLLCAARLGQGMAAAPPPRRAAGLQPPPSSTARPTTERRWGVLVLSDSPAFPSLATKLPALRGHAVHTAGAGAGQLGHSSFARACSTRTGCRRGKDPGGAWTRSLVDFYLAGLADGFVKGLFTSFLFSTMRRDLLCCQNGAFVQWLGWYNLSRSHRDLPMRDRAFLEALTRT